MFLLREAAGPSHNIFIDICEFGVVVFMQGLQNNEMYASTNLHSTLICGS
jgi:hypothetical protein